MPQAVALQDSNYYPGMSFTPGMSFLSSYRADRSGPDEISPDTSEILASISLVR